VGLQAGGGLLPIASTAALTLTLTIFLTPAAQAASPCERAVYLTFDIDALDPAFAPGTGTPVWGGLASWQAAAMLRDLAGINMVGGDIVEVSPPYDTTGATAVAGAHVAYDLIALFAWAKARRA
jgi:arginase family enzyme